MKKIPRNFEIVYDLVRQIPRGRVTTYALLADAVKRPGAARWIGNVMSFCPYSNVPCHRVIKSDGRVGGWGFEGSSEKVKLLRREGIKVSERGKIDLGRYLFLDFSLRKV